MTYTLDEVKTQEQGLEAKRKQYLRLKAISHTPSEDLLRVITGIEWEISRVALRKELLLKESKK